MIFLFKFNVDNKKKCQWCSLLFLLSRFDISFIGFLALPNKIPQNSHLVIVVFVEIEAISMPKTYLKKIVVQTLLAYLHLSGCILQRVSHLLVFLIDDPRVKLAPLDHLIDNVANAPLLSSSALALLGHLVRESPILLLAGVQVLE